MFLDSEPEEGFQLPRSGMPLKEKKKNGYAIVSDGENLHVLEFFAVGNKGKTVLFYSVKGSVRCHSHKPICFFIC